MIKAIFFDFDGTLVHSEEYYKLFAKKLEEAVIEVLGDKGLLVLEEYRKANDGAGELIINKYQEIGNRWYKKILEIDPINYFDKDAELIEFLNKFKKYNLYIYSNSPEQQIRQILCDKGINPDLFKGIFGWFYNEKFPKPDIGLLQTTLKNLKLKNEECLFVGDSQIVDLDPPQKLGIRTLNCKNMVISLLTKFLLNDLN